MKKIILLFMFCTGLIPIINHGNLTFSGMSAAHAQSTGDEYNYDDYVDDISESFDNGNVGYPVVPTDVTTTSSGVATLGIDPGNTALIEFLMQLASGRMLNEVTITAAPSGSSHGYIVTVPDVSNIYDFFDAINSYNQYQYQQSLPPPTSGTPPPPPPPTIIKPTDPCSDAAKKAGTDFSSTRSSLNSVTDVSSNLGDLHTTAVNAANEKTFMVLQNQSTGALSSSGVLTGSSPTSVSGSISVPSGYDPTLDVHDHPDNRPQSPKDIFDFMADHSNYSTDMGTLVITPGTEFVVLITNPGDYAKFASTHNASNSLNGDYFSGKMGTAYDNVSDNVRSHSSFGINSAEAIADGQAAGLAYVLQNYSTGLTLFQKDAATGNFKPVRAEDIEDGSVDPLNPTHTFSKTTCP